MHLVKGATVYVVEKPDHGWWLGIVTNEEGMKQGYFPKNYVVPKGDEISAGESESSAKSAERKQFSMNSLEAFDQLVDLGFAIENKFDSSVPDAPTIPKCTRVRLSCTASVWDGTDTTIEEYATGDTAPEQIDYIHFHL